MDINPIAMGFPSNSKLQLIFNTTTLAAYLDHEVMVLLLDRRILIGTIRSFDTHGNIVLSDAFERILVGHLYCDNPMGVLIQGGEYLALIAELDSTLPQLPSHMTNVSLLEILMAKKAEDSSLLKRNLNKWIEEFLD